MENTFTQYVSESSSQEQVFIWVFGVGSCGLRQIFQCGAPAGTGLNSWWTVLELVDTVRWGIWNEPWYVNSCLFIKVFAQVSSLVSYAWAVYPDKECIWSDKLVFKNFLRHIVHVCIGSILFFLGKNFLEHTVKSCWHRKPHVAQIPWAHF